MGDSTQTSTSSTASSDPKVQQTLDQLLSGIQSIYKAGPQVYGKSLYSPAGSTTQDAWSQGTNFANGLLNSGGLNSQQTSADKSLGNIGSAYAGLGANGGLTASQSGAQSQLGSLYGLFSGLADNNGLTSGQQSNVNGANAVGRQYAGLGDNNGLTGAQSTDLSKLGGLSGQYGALSGAYDQTAPGYQQLRDKASSDALSSVNSMFGGSGRLGSGLNYQSAAQGVTNALAPLDYQNYQNSVNNKLGILNDQQGLYQNLFGDQQAGVGNQMSALAGQLGAQGQSFNQQQTGVGNQANAYGSQANLANSIFGNAQTGVGNEFNSLSGRTGIANQKFANGQTAIGNEGSALSTLGGIGNAQDANKQGILTGNANLWDAQHNGQLGLLSQIMQALNGSAQLGGTTTTQTQPGTPWWQQLLGGAIGGASLAAKL